MDSGGIYIHIPFCRQACRYCDFFFTVSLKYQDAFVDALVSEIEHKAKSKSHPEMESLYLGGGTPSLLTRANLEKIMEAIHRCYRIAADAEITVECNPDDLDDPTPKILREAGVNRLSIGIQSFRNRELELMRRSHGARQALNSIGEACAAGFDNLSIDLIYGIPGQSTGDWEENLEKVRELPVEHLSAYHLSFEPGTVFDHWRKKGRISPVEDETSEEMYRLLCQWMAGLGFEHYEISNFAKPGRRSRHNQRYWSGQSYLGFGPAAHSYDGFVRSWNKPSLKAYLEHGAEGDPPSESEVLTEGEKYHDFLIMNLRTARGISQDEIKSRFGQDIYRHFSEKAGRLLYNGTLVERGGMVAIDPEKWLMADRFIRDLFLD